jgi:serine/alanine adding enzyme
MNIHIHTSISEINQEQWKELVDSSPNASFFQTPECYGFFASLSFLKPFVYGVSENNKLVGIVSGYVISDGSLLKKFLSRRAIVPGGLLLATSVSDKAIERLLKRFRKELRYKSIYLEIRNYNDYSATRPAIEKSKFIYMPHLNFHVATPSLDDALKQLSTTKRRDIKLSRKAGAEWIETTDASEIAEYYRILSELYKTKVKTPLFPLEFFQKLALLPNGKIFVLKLENEIIGGSVCVLLPGKTLYEWFVCGLDGKYKNVFPSTMATWAAIEYSATNGIPRFDMMGAGKPDDGYGVREFKSKFGGELVEHGRFIHVNNPLLYKIGTLGVKLYRTSFHRAVKTKKPTSGYRIESDAAKIDKQVWATFVNDHPQGNIFQTPQMYEVYSKTKNFKPEIFIAYNSKGAIVGCLMGCLQREFWGIAGYFTARAIVHGGPLVENNNPEIVDLLLKKFNNKLKNKAVFSQFRNLVEMEDFKKVFEQNEFAFSEHLDILLDLTKSREELESLLHKERKRNIAFAIKEGLRFKHLTEPNEISEVVKLIKKTYRRVKVPMNYDELFVNAKNILGSEVKFFGAYYEDKMIAGQVRLCYNGLVYAWFAGSAADYFNKRPNDFLQWQVICWSKDNNYTKFDFGGAGKPGIPYGVRDYKLKFGGELVNYGRFDNTYNPMLMAFGKKIYSIYNRKKGSR